MAYQGTNVKRLFRSAARKLAEDFTSSAEAFTHQGQRGEYRENALKTFLAQGRLPDAYGVTSGSIVSPSAERSAQTDLLFYDRLRGPSFLANGNASLYPIESVYGICEVKSTLDKAELTDAFNKIVLFKSMTPAFGMRSSTNLTVPVERFGVIFAYRAGTSIDALLDNLHQLQRQTERHLWPNLVAVLNEDVLVNRNGMDELLFAHQLRDGSAAARLYANDDTLFEFYARLHTLLAHIRLDPFDISLYGRFGSNVGGYHVHGHMWARTDGQVWRYSDDFILKVIAARQSRRRERGRPSTQAQVLQYQYGTVPTGLSERFLAAPAFLYNPTDVPPTTDIASALSEQDGQMRSKSPLIPSESFFVGGEVMIVPWAAVCAEDTEVVEGLMPEDL